MFKTKTKSCDFASSHVRYPHQYIYCHRIISIKSTFALTPYFHTSFFLIFLSLAHPDTYMSFYKNEQKRIEALIKEPLLELVLQYLPHLQVGGATNREDVWEVVAMKLNTHRVAATLESRDNRDNRTDEIPIFSGRYVADVFKKLIDEYSSKVRRSSLGHECNAEAARMKERSSDRVDALLYELYILRYYDVEVMAKLSKERLEECAKEIIYGDTNGGPTTTKDVLAAAKEQSAIDERELYEAKLAQKMAQLDKLTEDNKRLLDLNHELLSNRN